MSHPSATVIFMDDEQITEIPAGMRLDPYCSLNPRFLGVIDANAILAASTMTAAKGRTGGPGSCG